MYWKIKKAIYGLERDGVDSAVLTVKLLRHFLNMTIKSKDLYYQTKHMAAANSGFAKLLFSGLYNLCGKHRQHPLARKR